MRWRGAGPDRSGGAGAARGRGRTVASSPRTSGERFRHPAGQRAAGLASRARPPQAIPWKPTGPTCQSGPATNLRNLSAVAQGAAIPQVKINTAVRWARRLVDGGLDIDYDPEHGFREVPAPEGGGHIAAVLAEASPRWSGAPARPGRPERPPRDG